MLNVESFAPAGAFNFYYRIIPTACAVGYKYVALTGLADATARVVYVAPHVNILPVRQARN